MERLPRQQRLINSAKGKTRECSSCNQVKDLVDFYTTDSFHNPFGKICSPCRKHLTTKPKPSNTKTRKVVACNRCRKRKSIGRGFKGWEGGICEDCEHYLTNVEKRKTQQSKKTFAASREMSQVRKETYQWYMQSAAWRQKRLEYWNSKILRECYFCAKPWEGFQGMELHHRTYKRFMQEHLEDLVPLCPSCHKIVTLRWNEIKKYQYSVSKKDRVTLWQVTEWCKKEVQKNKS